MDLNDLPRSGMNYERCIVVFANPYSEDSSKKFSSVEVVCPRTGHVRFLGKLPQCLFMPGVCITGNNQIFVAGGAHRKLSHGHIESSRVSLVSESVSSKVYSLSLNPCAWDIKPPMTQARHQFCLVAVDDAVYAVGGRSESSLLDHVEKYDLYFGRWSVVAPLPQPLRCMTAVSYQGKLFVFGGETLGGITNTAYRYDPSLNTWTQLPPMSTSRVLACSAVFKNKIYVIGGNTTMTTKYKKEFLPECCTSSVEVFDPATNTWSLGPELANALCGAGAVKYGDTVVLVGGEDDKSWMAGMYALQELNGTLTWVAGRELPMVLSTFGCVVANVLKDILEAYDPV